MIDLPWALLKSRLKALSISAIIGPPIAVVSGLSFLFLYAFFTRGIDTRDVAGLTSFGLTMVVLSPVLGYFVVYIIGIIGIIFTYRIKVIELWHVYIFTMMTLMPFLHQFSWMIWLPVLASATICWRVTRKWHSPDPT